MTHIFQCLKIVGAHQIRFCSYLKTEVEQASETSCFTSKIVRWTRLKNRRLFDLFIEHIRSIFQRKLRFLSYCGCHTQLEKIRELRFHIVVEDSIHLGCNAMTRGFRKL